MACLQGWGQFAKLALFGLLMTWIEFWAMELGIFLTGGNSILNIVRNIDTHNDVRLNYNIRTALENLPVVKNTTR